MNTSSITEKKTAFSFKDALFKAIPENIAGRVLFWGALSPILLLFTLGVSFLCASPFSLYLPFLALLGSVVCLRWKTLGLCGCYCALALLLIVYYQGIPLDERLWQMGIVFTLAVDFFILLLASEEIETLISQIAETVRIRAKELNQSQLQLQQLSYAKDELQQSLEEEIRQLKDEAQQRLIEKHQESKRIELIQSEIEWLTSQKEGFVAEAKKAREIIEQDRQTQEKITVLEGRLLELSEEYAHRRASEEELTEKLRQAETLKTQVAALTTELAHAEIFKAENEALLARVAALTEKLDQAEDEKEAQLAALTERLIRAQEDSEEKRALQNQVATLTDSLSQAEANKRQNEALQSKVTILTESLYRSEAGMQESLLLAQEKIMTLQVTPVIKVDEKRINQLEGLHNQLRSQFDEKTRVLSQTRQDLFHTQGKLLALQHEQQLDELAPGQDETSYFEKEISRMAEEIFSLEEEVLTLEELVSFQK